MLRWFVEDNIVEMAIKSLGKYLIDEEDVETRLERVPCAVLDENVDVHLIRKFFTNDAWLVVVNVLEQSKGIQTLYVNAATMTFTKHHQLYVNIVYHGITLSVLG